MTTGYVYFSDDRRHADLVDGRGSFSDVLPSAPKLEVRQAALISLDGAAVHFAALMTRGAKAASFKWRVMFEDFKEINPPLDFQELHEHLTPKTSATIVAGRQAKGVQLWSEAWTEVRQALADLRPDNDLGAIEHKAAARRPRAPSGDQEPIVAYEHDAVGLALSLSGIDRKRVLESWSGADDAPFLRGLPEFNVLEDQMIPHDASVFGDWEQVRKGAVGMAVFRDGDRRLTVINVNRAGVEHALGVDLVYYNHDFDAYVLVQYKRMTPRTDASGYEFRPDSQLDKELERMRSLRGPGEAAANARDYRLDDGGAYLKLCPSIVRDAFSSELIRGMYLPLRYWDAVVQTQAVRGPKGGIRVDFDNVGRHITNTLFIDLVGSAWIGSRGVTSEQITVIVRESLATRRSMILAEAEHTRVRHM